MIPTRKSLNRYGLNRGVIAETGQIPLGMHLIQDTCSFEIKEKVNTVTEGTNGREIPVTKVTGLFQSGDSTNANGRVYPTEDVLIPAVRSIQEDIQHRAVMGEYDHPSDAKIHLDRVSHLITDIWMEGKKVFGTAEVLHNQPCGASLRGLFEHKVRVGISSRGVGDMEVTMSEGSEVYRVMPGYAFVTWDAVAEPSVSGAILGIQESINKRIKPLAKQRSVIGDKAYHKLLVSEINNYFGLDKKKYF